MQRRISHRGRGHLAAVLIVALLSAGRAIGGENAAEPPLRSGRAVGEYVPTFYVRAVNGPLMNKSVCFVCRNGSRPVVMVLLQEMREFNEYRMLIFGLTMIVMMIWRPQGLLPMQRPHLELKS